MDNINFPKLKKLFAMIPEELFDELSKRDILNHDFDRWITEAILEKLNREEAKNGIDKS
jgi:hypothetical protein